MTVRSMFSILCAVVDGEINTPEQGAALLDEEARDYADVLKIPEDQARAQLITNIHHAAHLCLKSDAGKLRTIFKTENKPDAKPTDGAGRMPI